MEEQISEVLRSIGLNKAEVEVYLDLLKYGPSSALNISKRTHLYRSNTYDSLRRLIQKGFIKETVEENKRFFTAQEPEKIKQYVKEKELEVEKIIPYLKEVSKKDFEERQTSISQGPISIKNALLEVLDLNQPIQMFINSAHAEMLGEGFLEDFHRERKAKKITLKMICYNTPIQKIKTMPYTEVKSLDIEKEYPIAKIFCGDLVYLLTLDKPITAIEIRSKELAESFRNLFDHVWSTSKEAEPRKMKIMHSMEMPVMEMSSSKGKVRLMHTSH